MSTSALLALADGSLFYGVSIGVEGVSTGELVFNTAMTGYQEILTDPSYAEQLVTFTMPHIGNTGINDGDSESERAHVAGLVIRDLPIESSSWRQQKTLGDYLKQQKVIGIAGVDTRQLTRLLREKGAQNACLMAGDVDEATALAAARGFPGLHNQDLAKVVSTRTVRTWDKPTLCPLSYSERPPLPAAEADFHVVAYDFGVKQQILRLLVDQGCRITLVPAQTPADTVLAMKPDGVFLSNGPGDPAPCTYAIENIQAFLAAGMPLFGICLGFQLLALSLGAKTYKMKFGHHGANHPVQCHADRRVFITSQNHGFAVDEESLPSTVHVTHRSLFDGTLQGFACIDKPAFGFQGHPEASPGPQDITHLFAEFSMLMRTHQEEKHYAKAD